MKTSRILLFTVFCCISAASTAQMATINTGILQPATVTIPERIKKIYLASRCGDDSQQSQAEANAISSIMKLRLIIESTGRYYVNVRDLDSGYRTTNTASPAILDWEVVNRLTFRDTTAILVVLEKYEITLNARGMNQEHYLWRMYDYATQSVMDGFDHVSDLPNGRPQATTAADVYSRRIMMHWEWAQRDYYKGGNKLMRTAAHCLDTSGWEGAAKLWQQVAADSTNDRKTAAKACYNMALYCERKGDIAGAQEWLARSKRLDEIIPVFYARAIRQRVPEAQLLSQQLAARQGQLPLPEFENTIQPHKSASMRQEKTVRKSSTASPAIIPPDDKR